MSAYTEIGDWCIAQGRKFRVTRELPWEIGAKGSGLFVRVAPGFLFDVSVPVGLRQIFDPRDPHYLKAACLHDATLAMGWDRRTAAALFQEALEADGVAPLRRLLMWLAVSLWRWS